MEILNKQNRLSDTLFQDVWNMKQEKTKEVIKKYASIDQNKNRLHQNTKHLKKVCVTNSIRETAKLMLEKTGQLEYMDFVISNEDVKNPKPSSEGYDNAIRKLKLQPNECMVVEDSPKGIEAGKLSKANVYEVNGYYDVTLENILKKINYFNMM